LPALGVVFEIKVDMGGDRIVRLSFRFIPDAPNNPGAVVWDRHGFGLMMSSLLNEILM